MNNQAPYVSTGAFKTRTVAELVEWALKAGLDRIELSSGAAWSPDMLDRVRETSGAPIHYLVHNYFPAPRTPFVLNLASSDAASLAQSRAHCRGAVDLAAELNAPMYSFHAGFAFSARPEQLGKNLTDAPRVPLDDAHAIFVESLKELCHYGETKNVRIVVENNVVAPFNLIHGENKLLLCATAEDMLRTYSDVGSSNLGFLVDTGHVKVSAKSLGFDVHAFLDQVKPHLIAFHLSDNDGLSDSNAPVDEKSWFVPRLSEFPEAIIVLEAYSLEIDEIRANCDLIEKARRTPAHLNTE